MIDRSTFVLYPYIDRHFRSWTITPDGEDLKVMHNHSLWDALATALGVDAVTVLIEESYIRVKREDLTPLDEFEALANKAKGGCTKHDSGGCDCR